MKKFIPYIFITAFIGAFLMISFSPSFSGTFSGPEKAEAGIVYDTIHYSLTQFWKGLNDVESYAFGTLTLTGGIWGEGGVLTWTMGYVTAVISEFIFYLASWLFHFSTQLLDFTIQFSVVDFKTNIDNIGVINAGHKIVLNVANMIFIFLLLYIAIKTILGVGGDAKKLLTSIIVVALMINFSLFMTKVIIDASNIIAIGFFNSIQTVFEETEGGKRRIVDGSVAVAFTSGLKLQTQIYNPKSMAIANDPNKGLDKLHISLNFLGGAALLLVSAFVFLSVALLFIVRFIALLFYLIFSPVAFLGYISPSSELKSHASNWWKGLLSQTMFAPAFLFIAYLISSIINSGKLWDAVGGDNTGEATFFNAIQTAFGTGFPIIMNYVILIALMIGGLITAKTMASVGSHGAVGYAQKFQNWAQGMAGRNTIGRAAYLAGNNRYMGKIMKKMPTLGTFAKTQFDNVAGAKFGKGNKISYTEALKRSVEKKKKMGEFVGKAKVAKTDELIRKEEERLDRMKSLKELKDNADKAQKERNRLSGIANTTYDAADIIAADLARETSLREEALFENRIDAELRVQDLASYKRKVQERMKKEYAKNIEFESGILNKLFPSGADAAAEIRKGKSKGEKEISELLEKLVGEKVKEKEGVSPKEEKPKE